VVVSEFMLQQTQVERVVPVFERFIGRFGSFSALAAAPVGEVVRAWQGLGYNSRAVRLHALARWICERRGGALPTSRTALRALSGVGPYTAQAIRVFAQGRREIALDTNARRVLQRVFFAPWHRSAPSDDELQRAGSKLLRNVSAFDVNSALMDLGSAICTARAPRCLLCPLSSVCAAAPIGDATPSPRGGEAAGKRRSIPFEQTARYLRGRIVEALRALPPGVTVSLLDLQRAIAARSPQKTRDEIRSAITALARDGVVCFDGVRASL
jgi:A/G-specific adenine glycosylase